VSGPQQGLSAAKPVTLLVVNSGETVRQLVETVAQECHLNRHVELIFSEGLTPRGPASSPDVVLINLTSPAQPSLALLPKIRWQWPRVKVIFLSLFDDIHLWAEAIRLGAYEFLPHPVDPEQLKWVLQGALETREQQVLSC
jgi:two-component system nitrogen regulation response regulator GlnG